MNIEAQMVVPSASLSAKLIHGDGSQEDCGVISQGYLVQELPPATQNKLCWLVYLIYVLAAIGVYKLGVEVWRLLFGVGLVTNAGVDYMATEFASGTASPTIGGMKYHDCGTGTTAAAVTD